jgi:tetratricopeptide (TPR) repeat protein
MDGLWVILAGGLADQGHVTRAATVAQRISNPWVLASMRADRRFDGLFDHAAARFDPEAAWGAQLEMRRKLMADHPAELSYVSDYVGELIYTHHPDMALKLIDDALARVAAAPKGKPAYTDLDDKLIWIKDARAHALFELSRADEAVAMLVTASAEKENGGANVSQVINLGELYVRLGRPQDALNSVARAVTNMSPYGRMQAEGVKAWAYAQLADKENLAKSLAYVRAHETDAPGSLPDVLIGANDLDGAAAIYIRRLADPDTRLQALDELQAYAPSLHTTPVMQESDRRWRALVARPDMKAAIDKVGRVNSYSFMAAPG